MSEFEALRELRADVPPMSAHAHNQGQLRLAAAMTGPERRLALGTWFRRPAGYRGVAVAASAFVATAAAAIATVVVVAAPGVQQPAQAADILNRAAAAAAAEDSPTPRSDQYIYQEIDQLTSTPTPVNRIQTWTSVDGTGPGRSVSTERPCPPPLPEKTTVRNPQTGSMEEMTRVRVGSPEGVPNCRQERALEVYSARDGLSYAPYTVLAALPTDPTALVERLKADPQANMASPDAGLNREVQVWTVIRGMATNMPSAQRAALFRAAAALRGMTLHENVSDAAGRRGVGVGMDDPRLGHVVLIFDRSSYRFLGESIQQTRGGAVSLQYALLRTAVVDRVGQLPG